MGNKRIKSISAAVLISAATLSAQNVPSMVTGCDPALMAMAGAAVAAAPDAYAAENNAAAISLSGNTMDIAAAYGLWQPEYAHSTIMGFGGYYRINDRMGIGLSGKFFKDREVYLTSPAGAPMGTYTPSEKVAGLGFSYKVTDGLSAGVNVRFVSSDIAENVSGSSVGADISAAYRNGPVRAGLAVCNLGPAIKYDKASSSLPSLAKLGGAYSAVVGGRSSIDVSAEADLFFAGGFMAGAGLQYSYSDMVFARAGYHYGDAEKAIPSFASLGLGVKFAGVHLDAAYLLGNEVTGGTYVIGLGYGF